MDLWEVGCEDGRNAGMVFGDDGIDLSLRWRDAENATEAERKRVLARVDEYCAEFERRIRSLGGIGFWLGGIGPDGHIAFNCAGSDPFGTTRLCELNYPTQAAAAGDLGGIEVARNSLAVTIGLGTIAHSPDALAIVFAAGDAKAKMVRRAVTAAPDPQVPATALHGMDCARFIVTRSAASLLPERRLEDLRKGCTQLQMERQCGTAVQMLDVYAEPLIDLALERECRVLELPLQEDILQERVVQILFPADPGVGAAEDEASRRKAMAAICGKIDTGLRDKIENGVRPREKVRVLHTAPHHDDIMLGYLPFAAALLGSETNKHRFSYGTSGFNAVTNDYTRGRIIAARAYLDRAAALLHSGYFSPCNREAYDGDISHYLDGHAARDEAMKADAVSRRVLRIVVAVYCTDRGLWQARAADAGWLDASCAEALEYIAGRFAGQKDEPFFQTFKGMLREFEADLLWGYHGKLPSEVVSHWRLGFYKGDLFTEQPQMNRDVRPVVKQMGEFDPDFVSVALDPEGSGPDTHYKVLQVVAQAARHHAQRRPEKSIRIWGYRNVWFRFHPAEANLFVPVSLGELNVLNDAFLACFLTQKNASFPAPEYNGPFSHWSQQIQASQFRMLRTLLGEEYFTRHKNARVAGARGFVFIHELTVDEFVSRARDLHKTAER